MSLPSQELRLERVERLFVVNGLVDGVVVWSLDFNWNVPEKGFLISVKSHGFEALLENYLMTGYG